MGLAASQARLLTITARKADCEFMSMSLSHQKLALARDMERVSSDYQAAMSKTKFVYDYYGSGDTSLNLDYGILMTPSIYNDYYPKTVTDSKNRVILNSSLSAAARAAGIPVEGLAGTPSDNVRNTFIEALAGVGVITPGKAAAIESVPYGNTIGLGTSINTSMGFAELTYDELMERIEAATGGATSNDKFSEAGELGWALYNDDELDKINVSGDMMGISTFKNGVLNGEFYNGNGFANAPDIGLKELLDGDTEYVWLVQEGRGAATPITAAAYMQEFICGSSNISYSFVDYLVEMFSSVLGGVNANDAALQYAANAVYDIVYPNSDVTNIANNLIATHPEYVTGGRKDREGGDRGEDNETWRNALDAISVDQYWRYGHSTRSTVQENAQSNIGFSLSYNGDAGNKHQYHNIAINLNNLAKVFLTAFVQYQEGIDTSKYQFSRGKAADSTLYDPNRSDFKFTIATGLELESDEDNLYANFYDALFNQICMNGWTENDRIEDVEYLSDLFKNGLAFISTLSDDGYYYQGSVNTDRSILEVSDDNAIAVAEAQYNTEKAKIEHKENTIDMKMKNLDTEISSLTTEYDTTKQIITKSVEKSFKRYEA